MASSFARRLGVGRARRARTTSVLMVAIGACAGVALGVLLADRAGGLDGLLRRGDRGNGERPSRRRSPRVGAAGRGIQSETVGEESFDDDTELAPEMVTGSSEGPRGDRRQQPARDAVREAARAAGQAGRGHRTSRARPRAEEAALEARVLEVFMNDPILRERAIDICASGTGTIELTGWVQASSEIGHALTLARGVPDVSAVIDRLAVHGGEPTRDHSGNRYAGPPPGGSASAVRAD